MKRLDIDELAPWIEVRFDPASGPGGQHVNKVSTRATLLFDFQQCPAFSARQRSRIERRCASRLARDGRLRVSSQQSRSQADNRAAAEARLVAILREALHVPKKRVPTRPTAGSQRRRVKAKRQRGDLKRQRQSRPGREE